MIVLDTHVWIWWVVGDPRLTPSACDTIAEHEASGLGVSAISVWELAMLTSKQRLSLDRDVEAWTQIALAYPGFQLLPLTPAIAIESTRLPGTFHADPADRIIVATARVLGCTLLTMDRMVLDYPHVDAVRP